MDEMNPTFEHEELTAADLEILRAFQAMDDLDGPAAAICRNPQETENLPDSPGQKALLSEDENLLDDMLVLFITEADEEISVMRQALHSLEQDDTPGQQTLVLLKRAAHKLKGTAGAVGCASMSTISYYIEMLVGHIHEGVVLPMIGLMALVQALRALEATLQSITSTGQESSLPLTELEADYEALNEFGSLYPTPGRGNGVLPLNPEPITDQLELSELTKSVPALDNEEALSLNTLIQPPREREVFLPLPSAHIDLQRLKQLVIYSEHLAEQRAPLEDTHRQIEAALHELYAAQGRLQYLETLLSLHVFTPEETGHGKQQPALRIERPVSSLVARILDEAAQRTPHNNPYAQAKNRQQALALKAHEATSWDEMEVDRYTDYDVLIRAFNEAIADVTTASAQLRAAYMRFNRVLHKHMNLANDVRSATLMLHSTPLSTLLPRIQRAIRMSADAQQRQIDFSTIGEATEIDQEILEALARPLLQLVRFCVMDTVGTRENALHDQAWINAQAIGNEVSLEVGFSTLPRNPNNALELVHRPLQQLNGQVHAQPNTRGGLSFFLTLPRLHGAMPGLLVRAGRQRVVVPFSQVKRIDPHAQGSRSLLSICSLNELLGFPNEPITRDDARPVLMMQPGSIYQFVSVDEVLGGVELVVKPLAAHLQRPGITGVALDSQGNVLLIADLPKLMSQRLQPHTQLEATPGAESSSHLPNQHTVLVADDSVYIRQSLQQMLSRAGYQVTQARDGMEAWEQLLEVPPDALLLDIEMPNLNGYELLSIIRTNPLLSNLKVIMLTARSSEKHRRSALELGAQAYLTKPTAPEALLATLQEVLKTPAQARS